MPDRQIITMLISSLMERGLIKSQADLANQLGIDPALISLIKSGKRDLTEDTKRLILTTFTNVNRDFLNNKSTRIFAEDNGMFHEPQEPYNNMKVLQTIIKAKDETIEAQQRMIYRLEFDLEECRRRLTDNPPQP